MHAPFIRKVQLQFLAQFPMDHLPQCYFVASYLFLLIALFCAAIRRDSVSLLRFPFLSHVHVFLCEMSLVSLLKRSYSCFFSPSLFSGYFLSVDPHVLSIISGGCNQSNSALFYVDFESYRCINAVFNASKSSSSFFFFYTNSLSTSCQGCKALYMIISFLILWSICLSSYLVHFKNYYYYPLLPFILYIPLLGHSRDLR